MVPRVASVIGADGIAKPLHPPGASDRERAPRRARRRGDGNRERQDAVLQRPVLESILADPSACALYLYPTKALAQDQLRTLTRYLDADPTLPLVAGTYDGDTPPNARRKLKNEANVLLTNPDMLHSGILPNHGTWARFLAKLKYVVVDEVHTYRGTFGSNVAHVLGRLNRICEHYGAKPTFIGCSATIRNPRELAEGLTGRAMHVVDDDGSPRGPKAFVIWNPPFFGDDRVERKSANVEAARILAELVGFDHQAIAFVRARVVSEIVAKYAQEFVSKFSPARAKLIKSYRGGYLPEERRQIERALFSGELKAVVSTNALELGIDIGSMEAAVLVGYPGSIASTWQQAGRAGRGADASLVVLLPYDSPIDQYMARHPDYFFGRSPENAVIDPLNAHILLSHVRAAAFDQPIRKEEAAAIPVSADPSSSYGGRPSGSTAGGQFYGAAQLSQRRRESVNIGDDVYTIILGTSALMASGGLKPCPTPPAVIGTIDESGAFQQLHAQAIYIHGGETYFVNELDTHKKIAWVQKEDTDYYTQSITETKIKVESEELHKSAPAFESYWGDLSVTSVTYMFKKIKFGSRDSLGFGALDLPTQTLDTTGMWLLPRVPTRSRRRRAVYRAKGCWASQRDPRGHPLYAMCDTMDVGASVYWSATNAPASSCTTASGRAGLLRPRADRRDSGGVFGASRLVCVLARVSLVRGLTAAAVLAPGSRRQCARAHSRQGSR
jgi:DEAD/DEAH box helicase domain-containing protein